jgi:hypothetical protein
VFLTFFGFLTFLAKNVFFGPNLVFDEFRVFDVFGKIVVLDQIGFGDMSDPDVSTPGSCHTVGNF